MKISIIIPFKDSLENLSNLFNSLKEQSYKNFEIILIDSSNDDKVFKLLKSFSYLKIFHKKNCASTFIRSNFKYINFWRKYTFV